MNRVGRQHPAVEVGILGLHKLDTHVHSPHLENVSCHS